MSRSSSGPDYDFGPYDDEYRGFDIRDDESGRGPLILMLALGVLLIFAGVVWNTYRQGVRPSEGGLPVIGADAAPYKRAPETSQAAQDVEPPAGFYDLMDGGAEAAPVRQAAMTSPVEIRRDSGTLAGAPVEAVPPVPSIPEQEDLTRRAAPIEFAEGLDVRKPLSEDAETVRTAALNPVAAEPAPARVIAPVLEPVREPAVSRFAGIGDYQVQLLASRSEAGALGAWDDIRGSEPALYQGAKLSIQRADLGARGVFYRLRLGTFVDRAAAKAFCDDVKSTGKDCIVVAKATG